MPNSLQADDHGPAAPDEPSRGGTFVTEEILSSWARQRPELETWPFRVLTAAAALENHLKGLLRTDFDAHGIKAGDYRLLSMVRRQEPPSQTSPTELSRGLDLTTGAVTRRLDRLEGDGLLVRLPHPKDRRAVVVELTDRGVVLVDAVVEDILRTLAAALEPVRSRVDDMEDFVAAVLLASNTPRSPRSVMP